VQSALLDGLRFKKEFNTQQKLDNYFNGNKSYEHLKDGLFALMANVIFIKDEKDYHYHFRINVFETSSYNSLDDHSKGALNGLYNKYFFEMQNELWKEAGILKLEALQSACNNMLLCGEDLGMVPNFVPAVLSEQHILSLQVERMPKRSDQQFSHPEFSSYDAVVTPGTHDMSTLRGWWIEDSNRTQNFYNNALGRAGAAPRDCNSDVATQIIAQHLYSPAMFAVFLLQDLLAMNDHLKKTDPNAERINDPADPNHIWNYRMPDLLETLIADDIFNSDLQQLIAASGRGIIA
jgi:4-alpha-glucanotransferase